MPEVFSDKKKTEQAKERSFKEAGLAHSGRLRLFSTFSMRPEGVTYENQDDDEEIILFLRRDFITNVPWLFLTLLLILAPILLINIPGLLQLSFSFSDLPLSYLSIILGFYYLLITGFIISNFLTWFYNISMVTSKKMVDIDYRLRYKNVANAPLEAIEEVEYTQQGFIRDFFDYGDIIVQTQAEVPNFEFEAVPRPGLVVDIVTDVIPKRGGDR